jgi:hypothetical protein
MKITKRGVPPSERKWVGQCTACSSEVEALEGELERIEADQREGTRFCRVVCPVCNLLRLILYPVRTQQ